MPRPGIRVSLMIFMQYTFVGIAFSGIALLISLFYEGQRAEALRLFSLVALPIMPAAGLVKIIWLSITWRSHR